MDVSTGVLVILMALMLLVVSSLLMFVVRTYNDLVRLGRDVDKTWSDIDVLLKQRSDELEKMIDTVAEYMDYEEDVLRDVTRARTMAQEAGTPREEGQADSAVQQALGSLFAVAEDYPDLQASDRFQTLQERITQLEQEIAQRRERYNETANRYNIYINQIPYKFVADPFNYRERELFEAPAEAHEDINVAEAFDR